MLVNDAINMVLQVANQKTVMTFVVVHDKYTWTEQEMKISFLAVQVIFICLYNQLFALFHYVFKFLTL